MCPEDTFGQSPQTENRLKKLIRIWRALHEYVNFVHDPEKQYRSLSACWNPGVTRKKRAARGHPPPRVLPCDFALARSSDLRSKAPPRAAGRRVREMAMAAWPAAAHEPEPELVGISSEAEPELAGIPPGPEEPEPRAMSVAKDLLRFCWYYRLY